VIHLVNETWYSLQDAQDFVLLSLPFHRSHELFFGGLSQIAALWLDDEEHNLNVTIDVNFYSAGVLLEEAICRIAALKTCKSLSVPLTDIT